MRDTHYWSVNVQKFEVGDVEFTSTKRAILDTGSSLVHFRESDYPNIIKEIKKGGTDCNFKVANSYDACICKSKDDFTNITFKFDKYYYEMIPGHYVV